MSGCITSGNLVRVSAWHELGGFDSRQFIDMVDYDFCFRLRERGYEILQINQPLLLHEMGKQTSHRLPGRLTTVLNHSAFRKYHIFRNWRYLQRNYPYTGEVWRRSYLLREFVKTLLFEEDRPSKARAMIRGVLDARRLRREDFVPWRTDSDRDTEDRRTKE